MSSPQDNKSIPGQNQLEMTGGVTQQYKSNSGQPASATIPQSTGEQMVHQTTTGEVPTMSTIGAPSNADMSFDISSYDPLQAHALQLTASAGLGDLYASSVPVTHTHATNMPVGNHTGAPVQPVTHPHLAVAGVGQPTQIGQNTGTTQQIVYTIAAPAGAAPGTTIALPQQAFASTSQPQQFYLTDANGTPLPVPQTIQISASALGLDTTNCSVAPEASVIIQTAAPAPTPVAAPAAPAVASAGSLEAVKNSNKRISTDEIAPAKKRQQTVAAPGPSALTTSLPITIPMLGQASAPPKPPPPAPAPLGALDDPMFLKKMTDFAKMSAEERRRHERNLREQQRSFKISQQIKELKNVLNEASIPFKPNKFSILLSVAEYIKQLQARAIMLDAEQKKLIATIRQTNDMVNSGQTPGEEKQKQNDEANGTNQVDKLFVQGLDYKAVFQECSAALSVAALDGRILECNREFEDLSGIKKEELMRQSLFTLLKNHETVFRAMGEMLNSDDDEIPDATVREGVTGPPPLKYYSGIVVQKNDTSLRMNITLSRTQDGNPRFFNCAMTAAT